MSKYKVLISEQTLNAIKQYKNKLENNPTAASQKLKAVLGEHNLKDMTVEDFADCIFRTKVPTILAEDQISGNGSDWNADELKILADMNCAVPCTVFDNGVHNNYGKAKDSRNAIKAHYKPFSAQLLFTPGALLHKSRLYKDCVRPDRKAVLTNDETAVDQVKFNAFYENKLLSILRYANDSAAANGKSAFITMPGIGAGVFAGEFKGKLESSLQVMLIHVLIKHIDELKNIKGVYFDPYTNNVENSAVRCGNSGPILLTRPFMHNLGKSQLLSPGDYNDTYDIKNADGTINSEKLNFTDCDMFSIVAWDHGSLPGNDYYTGSRKTDDGVKSAATSCMAELTGTKGSYDPTENKYKTPDGVSNWSTYVKQIPAKNRIFIAGKGQLCGNELCNGDANKKAYTDKGNLVDHGLNYNSSWKICDRLNRSHDLLCSAFKETYKSVVSSTQFQLAESFKNNFWNSEVGYPTFNKSILEITGSESKSGLEIMLEVHEALEKYKNAHPNPGVRDNNMMTAFDNLFTELGKRYGSISSIKQAEADHKAISKTEVSSNSNNVSQACC